MRGFLHVRLPCITYHELLDPQTLRLQLALGGQSGCDHACFLVHDVHRRHVREAPLLITE